jgi:molybdate transport system substrate-binding protein
MAMTIFRTPRRLAFLLLLAFGCTGGTEITNKRDDGDKEGPVVAFVAASTKDAVQEIADVFAKERKTEVKVTADDSSRLATQIVEGARADVYLSANEEWANFVKDKGLAQETTPLLGNSLVIVVPAGNPAKVGRPEDLTKSAVKRVAVAGPTVPAGIYARQALGKLGLWNALEKEKKVVSGENVRVTLMYVERGEADAGVVYATDAKLTNKVEQVFTFDPSTHEPIRYPLVLLKERPRTRDGQAFFDFLQSPAAAAIFRKYGFTVLASR